MEENIFANVPQEGDSIDEVLTTVDKELQEAKESTETVETKEPAESQAEKDTKQNEAWKELREAREQAEEKARILEARLQALEKGTVEDVEESEFVTALVGENAEVTKKWQDEKRSLKEEVKQELIQEQLTAQRKQQEEKEKWINWTNDRLSEVEKEFNVDFKTDESTKNQLSKVMIDYSPTDSQGNLDYRKGMKILTELNKVKVQEETQKTQVKKNIADATVSKETSVQKNKDYMTSNDFRGRGWRSVVGND